VKTSSHTLIDYIRSLVHRRYDVADGDRELLYRFVARRDDDAFAALMRRHGPMVLNLARRITGDEQLAEDVFQATFLLLSQKAHTIRRPEALPCWLHGSAHRLAVQARRSQLRHPQREAWAQPPSPPNPLEEPIAQEFLTVLDEELQKLPEPQRAPLILCCLEGLSQEEAAKRLGCSSGAIKGRLERGRDRLRLRLEKRGLTLPTVFGATLLTAGAVKALPPLLLQSTLHAATTGIGATPAVAVLIEETMRMMFLHKLKWIGAAVLLFVLGGAGVGTIALRPQAAKENSPPPVAAADDKPLSPDKRVDLYGDPLPEGAIMRLGTLQRRAAGTQIAVSADGKSIIAVRARKYVSVWDTATGKLSQTRKLSLDDRGFSSLAVISPQGRWLATYTFRDPGLTLWDLRTAEKKPTFIVRDAGEFSRVEFSPDGKRLAAVCSFNKGQAVYVWDVDAGRQVWQKRFDTFRGILNLTFGPNGKHLLVSFEASVAGTSCWNLDTGQRLWQNKEFEPFSMVLTRSGRIIAQEALKMKSLDLATGLPVPVENQRPVPWGTVRSCSSDGSTLLLGTARGMVCWDLTEGKALYTLTEAGNQAVFLPDGKSIVSNNGTLQRWDAATGKPLWSDTFERGHIDEVVTLVFSADGTRLASTSADGSVRLWDARTGKPLRVWRGHEPWRDTLKPHWQYENVHAVDITPDGRRLLSSGSGEEIKCWDADQDKEVRTLTLPPPAKNESRQVVLRVRISPDAAKALVLFAPRQYLGECPFKLATWDVKTGALLACCTFTLEQARPWAISPNGQAFLAKDFLRESTSGAKWLRLAEEPGGILPNVFSRDGALIVNSFLQSVNREGKSRLCYGVQMWESATGKRILRQETDVINWKMAIASDPRLVATLGGRWAEASNIQVWDVAAGRRLAIWKKADADNACIALAPNGQRLATGHPDGTILLWDVPLPTAKPQRLEVKELESLWTDLADADAAKAWRAIWRLADAPQDALAFLRGRVKPYPTAPVDATRKLLTDLDSDSFEAREAAGKRLKELGLQAESALRAALEAKPSLEQRKRIEPLLAALAETTEKPSAEELRQLRALIVLERIASPEARRMLEDVAKGPQAARLTRQARAALICLR
jgi:RNA polymerase sigma factor (sigma-70 family)